MSINDISQSCTGNAWEPSKELGEDRLEGRYYCEGYLQGLMEWASNETSKSSIFIENPKRGLVVPFHLSSPSLFIFLNQCASHRFLLHIQLMNIRLPIAGYAAGETVGSLLVHPSQQQCLMIFWWDMMCQITKHVQLLVLLDLPLPRAGCIKYMGSFNIINSDIHYIPAKHFYQTSAIKEARV